MTSIGTESTTNVGSHDRFDCMTSPGGMMTVADPSKPRDSTSNLASSELELSNENDICLRCPGEDEMKNDIPLQLRYGGLALMILSPLMILLGGGSFLAARSAGSWPTVEAHVVRSEIEVSKKVSGFRRSYTTSSDYFTPAVEYKYVVDGKQYTGDHIQRPSNPSGFDRSEIEQWTRKYPRGAEITVHYSPNNPSMAVIDPTGDILGFSLILGGGLIMFPVGLVLRRVARQLQPAPPTPVAVTTPVGATKVAAKPSHPVAMPQPAVQQATAEVAVQSPRKEGSRVSAPKQMHFLLRAMAVVSGLLFFFLGAVAFPKSVELCMQAVNAPGPDAAKTVAGLITMAIVGGLAILGAFLICRGTRPAMAS
jgi:hypothetical protein